MILGSLEYLFKYFYVIFLDSVSTESLKLYSGYKINIFLPKTNQAAISHIFSLVWLFLLAASNLSKSGVPGGVLDRDLLGWEEDMIHPL